MCRRCPAPNRRDALRLALGLAAVPLLAACGEGGVPVKLVSPEQVTQLGLQTWAKLRQEVPASTDAALNRRLQTVCTRLLRAIGKDPAKWEAVVFAKDEVNAFVLPGGKIGVFQGMFKVADNDDRLAAVVGHEIGHQQADHSTERLNATAARDIGVGLLGAGLEAGDVQNAREIAAAVGAGAEFGLLRPYSRNQELEADQLGLRSMHAAGYDAREAVELWRRMERASAGQGPDFLSTHPGAKARIAAIEATLPELTGQAAG